jgi:hypothetical protein
MDVQLIDTRGPRSRFIDVLAWTCLALAAVLALLCLPPDALVHELFPPQPAQAGGVAAAAPLAPAAQALVEHLQAALAAGLALAAVLLVAALGLLRRRNWARLTVLALCAVAIALLAAGVFVEHAFEQPWFVLPAGGAGGAAGDAFDANYQRLVAVLRTFADVLALALAGLLGWLIVRLRSRAVRAEFA